MCNSPRYLLTMTYLSYPFFTLSWSTPLASLCTAQCSTARSILRHCTGSGHITSQHDHSIRHMYVTCHMSRDMVIEAQYDLVLFLGLFMTLRYTACILFANLVHCSNLQYSPTLRIHALHCTTGSAVHTHSAYSTLHHMTVVTSHMHAMRFYAIQFSNTAFQT